MDMEVVEERSCWQKASGALCVALSEVFSWLSGVELAVSARVCGAWRAAARDSRLWRRLLRRAGVANHTLTALREHNPMISWRQEYVNVCAGWKLAAQVPGAQHGEGLEQRRGGGALLTHASLAAAGDRLAVAADDGTFAIWVQVNHVWQEEWSTDLRMRGWTGAVRSEWAAEGQEESEGHTGVGGRWLLVTGALALADRWELLVLQRDELGTYRSQARAGCSAGAGGCWAGTGVFLSLELCRLAPRLAITVVWLNAATQETQSEYAGVSSPLLRIFNEDSAHLTHVLVADVPLEALKTVSTDVCEEGSCSPGISYFLASTDTNRLIAEESVQTLVTASQGAGGALRAWSVSARRPPPLRARDAGDLRMRARRRRAAPVAAPEPDDPDEATVRAMCNPPEAECFLHAAILGLVLHSSARCMWASTADGSAWCLSLPTLQRLCMLSGADGAFPSDQYYIQPAVSPRYVASPARGRSAGVRLWSAATGALCPRPPQLSRASGAALVCLMSPRQQELLVLAGHYVHIWQSQATSQRN
ncbi:uncharacterized protein LOC128672755 isoform X2 [Plodia interpunctella]|uniref:uncharacterized protein LOC128672755 isoform X2 n=1 Tax=Plodia interpunctella TaxID=58824 RepID=UPI0023674B71|nr:uncharacterized protein LOC128672755 isoform X2 [Plodia interpunctella]